MARVLVIEDEPNIALVLTELLTEEGHAVVTAPNGLLGLNILEQSEIKPDIVFVDLNMPGISGKAVVETIQAKPRLSVIPVIVMTGSILSAEIMPPAGSYKDILSKPFDLLDVLSHVDTFTAPSTHKAISA